MNKNEIKKLLKEEFGDNFKYRSTELVSGSVGPMTATSAHRDRINTDTFKLSRFLKDLGITSDITITEVWKQTYKASEGYDPAYRTCYLKMAW